MAVAGEYAIAPPDERRALGDPDGPADETDSSSIPLPLPQSLGGVAWLRQETRATPAEDLATARKRQKELER